MVALIKFLTMQIMKSSFKSWIRRYFPVRVRNGLKYDYSNKGKVFLVRTLVRGIGNIKKMIIMKTFCSNNFYKEQNNWNSLHTPS